MKESEKIRKQIKDMRDFIKSVEKRVAELIPKLEKELIKEAEEKGIKPEVMMKYQRMTFRVTRIFLSRINLELIANCVFGNSNFSFLVSKMKLVKNTTKSLRVTKNK